MRAALLSALGLLFAMPGFAAEPAAAVTSCTACHSDPELFDAADIDGTVHAFAQDVHSSLGLSCHDCHGGNPDPALKDDMSAAMDESWSANPYRGAPLRTEIPAFCGRCHSDFAVMQRFRPDARVDQQSEYWSSRHGERLKQGDTRVATCIDCHGVHGIRRASDPQSSVYPTAVAATCGRCHSDPEHMKPYTLANGRALPVDQQSRWQRSVHAQAMLERGDLTAPTCNDCHGNHGARPPGVESVALICGRCHGREASLFRDSAKRQAFLDHEELAAGSSGCGECHGEGEPQANLTRTSFPECLTCHGNHSVVRPTVAMLGPLPETPCALCHEGPDAVERDAPEPELKKQNYESQRDALLASAESAGLVGDARFDWLVDRAQKLAAHTSEGPAAAEPLLRPEFHRLFTKFRIGKTTFTYLDPASGKEVTEKVTRCTDCHAAEPVATDEALGFETSRDLLAHMRELTVLTARAERTLLTARRGGVETRAALPDLDQAVDSQVALEVLVHTFSTAPGGAFLEKHAEGMQHAQGALAHARAAMAEFGFRRRGLAVSLGVILLVLLALAAKIRQLPP